MYKHVAVAFLSEKAQKLVDRGLFLPVSEEAADWEDDFGAHDHGAEPDGADGEAGGAGTRHVDTPPPNMPQLGHIGWRGVHMPSASPARLTISTIRFSAVVVRTEVVLPVCSLFADREEEPSIDQLLRLLGEKCHSDVLVHGL